MEIIRRRSPRRTLTCLPTSVRMTSVRRRKVNAMAETMPTSSTTPPTSTAKAYSETIEEAMLYLNTKKSMLENVIFSTCNRTEIYAVVDQIHVGRHQIKQFLAEWFDIEQETFTSYLQIEVNDAAIKHLFRVAVGLHSMVLGETQILGQVRDAFLAAQRIQTTGTIFRSEERRVGKGCE